MAKKIQTYVLALLRRAFGIEWGVGAELSPEEVAETARTIVKNGVLLTLYPVISKAAEKAERSASEDRETARSPERELEKLLRQKYYYKLNRILLQQSEGQAALEALSENGFECIALKGWELMGLYPDPSMREMSDVDILVRPYDFDRIKAVLTGSGFSAGTETSWMHDNFTKGEVTLEIHKRLTDDSDQIRSWETQMWKRATKKNGGIYRMSDGDYYLFHFIHMYKDFLNGSLGLRRLVDTWLLQKLQPDTDYVRSVLKKIGISEFHDRMVKLSRVCMGDADGDKESEILLSHAFKYGIFGTEKTYKVGRIVTFAGGDDPKSYKKGKMRSKLAAIFLPFSRMKAHYPVLEKHPVLLPWCWVRRIAGHLSGDTQKKKKMLDYSSIGIEDFEEMKTFFEAGGVRL